MYSKESLNKVIKLLNTRINYYKTLGDCKVCISSGNRKIGKVMNFSIAPIITCGKACKHCKGFCYDVKANLQYSNTVVDARARNTFLAFYKRNELFSRIDIAMNHRKKNKFFRFHVAGDIIDFDYFARMIEIARKHPDFIVWTYTKQYSIVNEYCDKYGKSAIPANFHIMFSKWDGLEMNNPHNFPVFACKLKGGNKDTSAEWFDNTFKCPGNCDICKACKRGCVAGESAWCDEH